jgi:hypothetical protein
MPPPVAEPWAPSPRWYNLIPHPEQLRLIHSRARFRVVPAGRRSGKTERAKRYIVRQAFRESAQGLWQDYRYFLGAPTRDQAKALYWEDLKSLIPPELRLGEPRESTLTLRLATGAELVVVGLDRPQRIEGRGWNGGILDEFANLKPGAWAANIRPALSDRNGWCWMIGVPEGLGDYKELFDYATSGVDPEWDGFTWKSADILPASEIESAKRTLDPLTYAQEYEAAFTTWQGKVYYPFDRRIHVDKLQYHPRADLIFAFDFNTSPGTASIVQEQRLPNGETGTGVIGEVWIDKNSNTPRICERLVNQWGEHQGNVLCYGDATGGAEGTAKVAGSDWSLIKQHLKPHFGERLKFKVPLANPLERVRVNAVNSRLLSASGTVRMMVDGRCANIIRDFEGVRATEDGAGAIDKKKDPKLSHLTDGVGYYVVAEFPVRPTRLVTGTMIGV